MANLTFNKYPSDITVEISNNSGTISNTDLSPGIYKIKAHKASYITKEFNVKVDSENIVKNIVLGLSKQHTLNIIADEGATISITNSGSSSITNNTKVDPGEYTINITKSGYISIKDKVIIDYFDTTKRYSMIESGNDLPAYDLILPEDIGIDNYKIEIYKDTQLINALKGVQPGLYTARLIHNDNIISNNLVIAHGRSKEIQVLVEYAKPCCYHISSNQPDSIIKIKTPDGDEITDKDGVLQADRYDILIAKYGYEIFNETIDIYEDYINEYTMTEVEKKNLKITVPEGATIEVHERYTGTKVEVN